MKTYLVYKSQIQGFENVSETVKVVEKVAASSVHFLRQEVNNLDLYSQEIEKILSRLSLFYQKSTHPLLQKKSGKRMLVVLTGEKGLVGGLWHNVINTFLTNRVEYDEVVVVGSKGESYLKEEGAPIVKFFPSSDGLPQEAEIKQITDYVFDKFTEFNFSKIDILYSKFFTLSQQEPVIINFLPFQFKLSSIEAGIGLPIFEPSKSIIFDRFLQKYINIFFHKIIMETKLSEFSARMVTMEHASAKTEEFVQKFTFDYIKERRRLVTQKQLESFAVHKII